MSRLIFFLALGMFAYFLIRKSLALGRPTPRDRRDPPPSPPSSPTRSYESADVVADPVCGTFVDPATAVSLTHDGNRLFFCSEACRDRFVSGAGD
jgi:YHS domain-containing protein